MSWFTDWLGSLTWSSIALRSLTSAPLARSTLAFTSLDWHFTRWYLFRWRWELLSHLTVLNHFLVRSQLRSFDWEVIFIRSKFIRHDGEPTHLLPALVSGYRSARLAGTRRLRITFFLCQHNHWFAHFTSTRWLLDLLLAPLCSRINLYAIGMIVTWVRVDIMCLQVITIY